MKKVKDFENLWFRYKTEGESKNLSIQQFCMQNGVSYNQFDNWFRTTCKDIVPIVIKDAPVEIDAQETVESPVVTSSKCQELSSLDEIFSFVSFLQKRLSEKDEQLTSIQSRLDNVFDQLCKSQKTNESNAKALVRLTEVMENLRRELLVTSKERDDLKAKLEAVRSENEVNKKFRFGSKSQKGVEKKTKNSRKDKDEDKGGFDG